MQTRNVILIVVLVLIAGLAFSTIADLVKNGVTGLAVVTIVILAVIGFGVVGALTEKNDG